MEKDKKYNLVLGLMIFFFILFVGVCVAWGLGFIGLKSNIESSTKGNTENVVNNDSNNVSESTNNSSQTNVVIKNTYVPFDASKIDLEEDTFIYPSTNWNVSAQIGAYENQDENYFIMEIDKLGGVIAKAVSSFYGFEKDKTYKVEGLNKKVLGIETTRNGFDIMENCILIMEDGTIENIAIEKGRLYTTGTIEGYSNVVRIEIHGITGYNRETGEGTGESIATFVVQGDGNIKHLPFIK